jgi:hypothetical protein
VLLVGNDEIIYSLGNRMVVVHDVNLEGANRWVSGVVGGFDVPVVLVENRRLAVVVECPEREPFSTQVLRLPNFRAPFYGPNPSWFLSPPSPFVPVCPFWHLWLTTMWSSIVHILDRATGLLLLLCTYSLC